MILPVGGRGSAAAAYVRVDLSAERLDQHYLLADDDGGRQRYEYGAPAFGFPCLLDCDESGLLIDYPGIVWRAH